MTVTPNRSRGRWAASDWPPIGPTVMALLLTGAMLYVVYEALGYSLLRTRLTPLVFGGFTAILTLTVLINEVRSLWRSRARPEASATVAGSGSDGDATTDEAGKFRLTFREVQAVGWFLVLVASFILLGFTLGMSLFIIVFLKVYGKEPWPLTLIFTCVIMAGIYGLFVEFLGVRIYPGVLEVPLPFGL